MLLADLPACSSYQPLADPAAALQPTPRPADKARVTLRTGTQFVLKAPRVVGDSIRGATETGQRRAVALSEVSYVEAPRRNGLATFFFTLLVVGLAVGAGLLIHSATEA